MNTGQAAPASRAQTETTNDIDWKRFHNPSLPIVVLSSDASILHLSPTARNLLGFRPGDSVNGSFFSMIHRKQLFQVMRDVADMVCHGKPSATWLLRLRTVSGRWQWFKADVRNRSDLPTAAVTVVLKAL
jgi:PAS domain-containing protein